MPKVSVVVPVYNAGPFLGQCLDSLVNQTFQDIEILCVNDGSTDRSLEILEEYAGRDRRIRIFSKKNEGKGAASARNLGLKHAVGTYVQFVDSDDFFEPDMIHALAEKAEQVQGDVIVCRADYYDEELHEITGEYRSIDFRHKPEKEPFSYKDCPEYIFQVGGMIAWNKLYRREFLEKHALKFEPIPVSDDQYVAVLSLVLAERIACVDRVLLHYRFHSGQSQCDTRTRHPEAAYAAFYSIVARMREEGIYQTVKRSYLNLAIHLLREYFDMMPEFQTVRFLYDVYTKEIFSFLEAEDLPDGYFYDKRIGDWYTLIRSCSLEDILFQTARGYGAGMTTAILRFQAPFEGIKRGSRIVLVGKGLIGRYWFSQYLLSDSCEVVCWVADESEIPPDLAYDQMIKAG